MGWFTRNPSQRQYIDSVVKVATNLYINTLSGINGVTTNFEFELFDSRFRYLIFCCTTVVTSVLAYDENKKVKPDELCNGCIQFLNWAGKEYSDEYFTQKENIQYLIDKTTNIFNDYLQEWSLWQELELQMKNNEIVDLICKMIRAAESEKLINDSDIKRLKGLGLEIDCRMPSMQEAVKELARK